MKNLKTMLFALFAAISLLPFILLQLAVLFNPLKQISADVIYYRWAFLLKKIQTAQGNLDPFWGNGIVWIIFIGMIALLTYFCKKVRNISSIWIAVSGVTGLLFIVCNMIATWWFFFNFKINVHFNTSGMSYYAVWAIFVIWGAMVVQFQRDMDKEIAKENSLKGGGIQPY